MKILYSDTCLEYSQPGHPESPDRVRSAYAFLEHKHDFLTPEAASDDDVLLVHTEQLLNQIRTGNFYDGDSPAYPNLYRHALLSAGGAIAAANLALEGSLSLSLMRPPGHHAGRSFLGGFCYFNNIAIAVAGILDRVEKVAIIDFDCHHGNGTQDIFLGHDSVLYVSLHQSPLYPGTGIQSELNCRNYPVMAGTDETGYMAVFSEAMGEVAEFKPDVIAISAGFDTYKEDPITRVALEIDSYQKIGRSIKSLGLPTFSVLEGGYSGKMPQCIESYLKGLDS
jgi:acetoin utilization deacetylase AcuC-like enzyme